MSTSSKTNNSISTGQRGRPREFNIASVSEAAAQIFWTQGYHSTSLDDLCEATGLLRGSLYGAFGDKRGVLLAALDQYADGSLARLSERLNSGLPPQEALRNALIHHARIASALSVQRGCLITNTALELLPNDLEVALRIESIMRRISTLLAAAVIRGQVAGVFSSTLNEKAVGDFLLCLTQGLRVLGKVLDDEERLMATVDIAMRALV